MQFNKEDALRIAKRWAHVLGIPEDKNIHILFGGKHKIASAQVRVLKKGKEIPDYAEDDVASNEFDTIEITLFDISEFNLSRGLKQQVFVSRILHELLHVRYPKWEEHDIQEAETGLIALLWGKLESNIKKE